MGIFESCTAPVLSHLVFVWTQKHCFSPIGLISTSSISIVVPCFSKDKKSKNLKKSQKKKWKVQNVSGSLENPRRSGPFRALCEGEANAASETQVGCVQDPAASGLVGVSGPHLKNLQIQINTEIDLNNYYNVLA